MMYLFTFCIFCEVLWLVTSTRDSYYKLCTEKIVNSTITSHKIVESEKLCAVECLNFERCVAANFARTTGDCELFEAINHNLICNLTTADSDVVAIIKIRIDTYNDSDTEEENDSTLEVTTTTTTTTTTEDSDSTLEVTTTTTEVTTTTTTTTEVTTTTEEAMLTSDVVDTSSQAPQDCSTILSNDPSACPVSSGYTCHDTLNGPVCLKFRLDDKQDHDAALADCSTVANGHLVFIENDEVLQIVRQNVISYGASESVWVDGYDTNNNQTPLSWNGKQIQFPSWEDGYPEQGKKCVTLSWATNLNKMETLDCTDVYGTVCQKEM